MKSLWRSGGGKVFKHVNFFRAEKLIMVCCVYIMQASLHKRWCEDLNPHDLEFRCCVLLLVSIFLPFSLFFGFSFTNKLKCILDSRRKYISCCFPLSAREKK